jgi:hypothetical protein
MGAPALPGFAGVQLGEIFRRYLSRDLWLVRGLAGAFGTQPSESPHAGHFRQPA